ncbi:hypothetical protein EWM64_g5752 [Hericium alpestre]|uniref:Uncharacterized protein n=1 Tax=Hericium alpestre TaxID=135208 RepID=A0A4Y9ZTY1_9AGAM|nr:hypothetical protein EWM64_g5752 [Hericium alpestre]
MSTTSPPQSPHTLPLHYPPLLLIHALVLSASLLLLPSTTEIIPFLPPAPPLARGLDKPQHPFLYPITAQPVLTMVWAVLGAVGTVGWWGGWVRMWFREGTMGSKGIQARLDRENRTADLINAWLFTFYAAVALNAVVILFGAPLSSYALYPSILTCDVLTGTAGTRHLPHSILLSVLLSILAFFVPAYALGLPPLPLPLISPSTAQGPTSSGALVLTNTWVRLFAELSPRSAPERALVYPYVGTFLGAWAGVIPIGLDWDRPWQAYPLTPAYGAAFGHVLGALGALGVSGLLWLAQTGREANEEDGTDEGAKKKKAKAKKAKVKAAAR